MKNLATLEKVNKVLDLNVEFPSKVDGSVVPTGHFYIISSESCSEFKSQTLSRAGATESG